MRQPPGGTVTFLFTDIEGSTRLLQQLGEAYAAVLEDHRRLLRAAFAAHGGHEVDTQGDAFFVAFARAGDAVAAAVEAQRALSAHEWAVEGMVRVRMGLHTGEPTRTQSGYVGMDVHRGARLMAAGHGGQVLLSRSTQELVRDDLPQGVRLHDLGEHRLKDLIRSERVFQLEAPGLPADFPPLKTLSNQPNNLPVQMTSFVGCEQQLHEVGQLLCNSRLLTLTGAGGTGKTRLALQAAAEALDEHGDGVWLVELAPLSDPDLVPQQVASALGVREEAGQPMTQTLRAYLAPKKLLLLLDNCEHLLTACAQLADTLLRACPDLRILASSREGLGIAGEQIYRVPSLSIPGPRETPSLEALSQYEAVRLLVERAVAAAPSFAVTNGNALAVAQICYRLDGIPLAIELAAARVKVMSVEQINARLEDRFRLLTGGSRTALPRQQTLRAMIDWGYDLLEEPERALLQRLSVFAGGWTLEAAEAVGSDETIEAWEVLDLLGHLVEKSLVVHDEQEGDSRYRLLETVRQYARDRLLESSGGEAVRERHLAYFFKLAEEAKGKSGGPQETQWMERLEQEHDNLRAALTWAQRPGDAGPSGLRLGYLLGRFWAVRGYLREGREHLSALLADTKAAGLTAARADALHTAGTLASSQGDYAAGRSSFEESLAIRRQIDDKQGIANSLGNLGAVAHDQGDYAAARAFEEESLAMRRDTGDKRGIAYSLSNLGSVAHRQGDHAAACALSEEGLAIAREIGDKRGIAYSLSNLGGVARDQGDYAAARALYEESLAVMQEMGNKQGIAAALEGCACAAAMQPAQDEGKGEVNEAHQHLERAARLWGAADALREAIGAPPSPVERAELDTHTAAARTALGEEAFAAAWAQGRATPLNEAIEYALDKAKETS